MNGLYTYRTSLMFFAADCGEREETMVIRYRVMPGAEATREEPAYGPSVRIAYIDIERPLGKQELPEWMVDHLDGDEALADQLLSNAADADEYARDQAADANREEQMLERGR